MSGWLKDDVIGFSIVDKTEDPIFFKGFLKNIFAVGKDIIHTQELIHRDIETSVRHQFAALIPS